MKNHIEELKTAVQHSTKKLLKMLIAFSMAGAAVNLLIAKMEVTPLVLAVMLIVNFSVTLLVAYYLHKDEQATINGFLATVKREVKAISVLETGKLVAVIIWFYILKLLSGFPAGVVIAPPVIMLMYILLTYADFKANFAIFEGKGLSLSIIGETVSELIKNRKYFFYVLMKIIAVLICGMVGATLLIIFIYSPQISAQMELLKDFDETILDPFFSTALSNFIQAFIAQITASVASIWIASLCLSISRKDERKVR